VTDDELLELAALAVCGTGWFSGAVFILKQGADVTCWNPLADDGEALRLAVRLDFAICVELMQNSVRIDGPCPLGLELVRQEIVGDPYAATRRAIVRAAAEVGRQLKEAGR
jgi:hypothetical protein